MAKSRVRKGARDPARDPARGPAVLPAPGSVAEFDPFNFRISYIGGN
ncbi:hypothetical protein [Gemmatimonas sp.]